MLRVEPGDCQVGRSWPRSSTCFKARAADRGLELTLAYRTPIPATIRTDAMRLRQILINLVSNAIKFTPSGSVRVEATLDESTPERPTLLVEVVDSGVGMTPGGRRPALRALLPGRPGRGSRAPGSAWRSASGWPGCSAAGSRSAASRASAAGSARACRPGRSAPTGGPSRPPAGLDTDEWATLPAAAGARPAAVRRRPRRRRPSAPAAPPSDLLLADDNRDLRTALAMRLRRGGAEVVAVEDGRRAVEEADRAATAGRPFDL